MERGRTLLGGRLSGDAHACSRVPQTVPFTAHEFASYANGTTAQVAPAALLVAGDDQQVRVTAIAGNVARTVAYRTPGPTLPQALTGVTFSAVQDDQAASFGALPPGET